MRPRIARAILAVTAGALALFGLPLAIAVQRVYRDDEVIRLERAATAATQSVGEETAGADPAELPREAATRLGLYGPTGRRIGGAGPAIADPVTRRALGGRLSDGSEPGRLIAAVPVARRERIVGAVRAERSDAVVARRVRRTRAAMAAIALAVLALAGAISLLLARRLVRPIDELAGAAARLGEGDFASRASGGGVPELDAAAGALNDTAGRLGAMVERERAFSADASHQLRTPLTALRLDLEAGQAAGATAEDVGRALVQVDRLEDTVSTLLAAARDAGPPDQHVDLGALLEELRDGWHGRLAADGRPLRIGFCDRPVVASASPGAVRQILEILLDNAHRHGAGVVTVSARAVHGAVVVEVGDEGPGVAADPEEVFTRRSPAAAGHGVGLALARSLAAADGGRLVLQRPGPAPTFSLLLHGPRDDRGRRVRPEA
jgi:signal transduction histidine kinase